MNFNGLNCLLILISALAILGPSLRNYNIIVNLESG